MPEQGTHFYFMSFIVPNVSGFSTHRRSGHFTPADGATRFDSFDMLLDAMKQESPELRNNAVVIAFDIQPNKL